MYNSIKIYLYNLIKIKEKERDEVENIIKLTINKSLVEQEQPILNLMENYKKILLQS